MLAHLKPLQIYLISCPKWSRLVPQFSLHPPRQLLQNATASCSHFLFFSCQAFQASNLPESPLLSPFSALLSVEERDGWWWHACTLCTGWSLKSGPRKLLEVGVEGSKNLVEYKCTFWQYIVWQGAPEKGHWPLDASLQCSKKEALYKAHISQHL